MPAIKVNTKAIQRLADAIGRKVNPDKIPDPKTLTRLGQIARRAVVDNIRVGKKNVVTRRPWPPMSASRERQRKKKGNLRQGLLWDEGDLLRSIKVRTVGRPRISLIEVFSDDDPKKVRALDQGVRSRKLPARRFLGVGQKSVRLVVKVIEKRMTTLLQAATR